VTIAELNRYLKTVLSRWRQSAVLLCFDQWPFIEPPFQFIKAMALNKFLGAKISKRAYVSKGVVALYWRAFSLGDYAYVSRYVKMEGSAGISIGNWSTISPGVFIGGGGHRLEDLAPTQAPVAIGRGVFVGANATILGGVTIGDHAVIGAGSLVNRDIPSCGVAVGVPAKVIKMRQTPERAWTLFGIVNAATGSLEGPQ
jgi:acetyltransferase-like isoleucine patch superfamily enzyme